MSRARALVLIAALGVLVFALAVSGSGEQRKPYAGVTHGPRPAPDCLTLSPPCPPKQPEERLAEAEANDLIGFTFAPPPPDAKPPVDADEAMDIAWQEGGSAGESQTPTLVVVPKGGDFAKDTLVWIIRYDGSSFCPSTVVRASPPVHGTCQIRPAFTMIDAESGDFIISWTPPPEK